MTYLNSNTEMVQIGRSFSTARAEPLYAFGLQRVVFFSVCGGNIDHLENAERPHLPQELA